MPELQPLTFKTDPELIRAMDSARKHASRSLFIREAIAEKLRSLGVEVSDDMIFAPDRAQSARVSDETGPAAPERKAVSYRQPAKKKKAAKG